MNKKVEGVIELLSEDAHFASEPPESPGDKPILYRPSGWPKNRAILPIQILDPPEPVKRPPENSPAE